MKLAFILFGALDMTAFHFGNADHALVESLNRPINDVSSTAHHLVVDNECRFPLVRLCFRCARQYPPLRVVAPRRPPQPSGPRIPHSIRSPHRAPFPQHGLSLPFLMKVRYYRFQVMTTTFFRHARMMSFVGISPVVACTSLTSMHYYSTMKTFMCKFKHHLPQ